jgi:hypothetical protein
MEQFNLFGRAVAAGGCPVLGSIMRPGEPDGVLILDGEPDSCGVTWDCDPCNYPAHDWNSCPRRQSVLDQTSGRRKRAAYGTA